MTYYMQSSGEGHHIAISVLHDNMLCEHLYDSDQLPLVSWRRKREKRGKDGGREGKGREQSENLPAQHNTLPPHLALVASGC